MRDGRGAGGGRRVGGGGRAGGRGSGFKIFESPLSWASPSSSLSSCALGTISERNSKSSDDNANEPRELEVLNPLCLREKRLKNRETPEGA